MGMTWEARAINADQANRVFASPDGLWDLLEEVGDLAALDLDKAWHGLHFLLTGSPYDSTPPLGAAIMGGYPFGEDAGYGPPRLLDPPGTAEVARALAVIDVPSLHDRFDPAELARADVYPQIWDEEEVFDDYLAPSYEDLKGFYAYAAEHGLGVLQVLH